LESQQQENTSVKKEFDLLDDDANIYKQIGPVLLKQDKSEAVMAVNGRLEFINKEMWDYKLDAQPPHKANVLQPTHRNTYKRHPRQE